MILRWLLIVAVGCLAFSQIGRAQSPSASPSPQTAAGFDPVQATKAWLATVPADQRAKSNAYFEGGYWLLLWNFLVGAAIAIFLLASTISAQLRDFAERVTGSKTLQTAIYAIVYMVVVAVLSFPLAFYQSFIREHQYGFATQTFVPWFLEQLIGLIVGLIESYTTQFLDPGLIDIVVFGLLLLMLAIKPTGLISERREENV